MLAILGTPRKDYAPILANGKGSVKGGAGPKGVTLCRDTESLAAGLEEVDRTDEHDRHQENEGGEKSVNNHNHLPKNREREVQAESQRHGVCFQ
jgi:hypothetical protein